LEGIAQGLKGFHEGVGVVDFSVFIQTNSSVDGVIGFTDDGFDVFNSLDIVSFFDGFLSSNC